MNWKLVSLAGALLISSGLTAQDLEQRLRDLETRAARAETLAQRVQELEGRLQVYEQADQGAALEASINALTSGQQAAAVTARKASAITLGGQFRIRGESRTPYSYTTATGPTATQIVPDHLFALMRTRINVDARVADTVRVFAELQDARYLGEEGGVLTDTAGVDLHQGYADLEKILGSDLTLRMGRFEQSLWNQRLISPLDWSMIGRSWDGMQVFGSMGDLDVLAGWQVIRDDIPAPTPNTDHFESLAVTWKGLKDQNLGAGYLWFESPSGGDQSIGTFTLHGDGKCGSFDWSADLAWQTGRRGSNDVDASAYAATVGYTFEGALKPRLSAEWTWASGDEDSGDGTYETFNPLFPFGHAYQGTMDLFSWKNGTDLAVRAEIKPADAWSVELALHGFWLDTSNDAWYGASTGVIRPALAGASDQLGHELDLTVKYGLAKNTLLWFGWSRFFAGDFVSETSAASGGSSDDADWIWAQLTATF